MSITTWTPPFLDGWYPKLSPDGTRLLVGNAIGRVIDLATKKTIVLPGPRWISQGWFNDGQLCVSGDIGQGWGMYRFDAPAFDKATRVGPSLNFAGVGGNVWAGGNTQKVFAGDVNGHPRQLWPRPDHPEDPTPGYAATVDETGLVVCAVNVHVKTEFVVLTVGQQIQRRYHPTGAPNSFLIGAGGYVGNGYYGPSWLNNPLGVTSEVGCTPNRQEGPPLAFRHLGQVWLVTTYDQGVLLRPLGIRDRAILISIPFHDPYGGAVSASVVSLGDHFVVASSDAKGRLTMAWVPADTLLLPVPVPGTPPPKPQPPPVEVIRATIKSYQTPIEVGESSLARAEITSGQPDQLRWQYEDRSAWLTAATNPASKLDYRYANLKAGRYPIRLQALKNGKVMDTSSNTSRVLEVLPKVVEPPPIDPPDPVEPPEPEPAPGTAQIHVNQTGDNAPIPGAKVWHQWNTSVTAVTDQDGSAVLPVPGMVSGVCAKKDGYFSPGLPDQDHTCVLLQEPVVHLLLQPVPPPAPPGSLRTGLVVADGKRHFRDGQGRFWPLGETLMWALHGWKFERDRVKANIDYVAKYDYDYIRILMQAGWPGNEIREDWPDHVQIAIELFQYCWSKGVRVGVTGIGGVAKGGHMNPDLIIDHAIQACRAVPDAVQWVEVANEYKSNFDDEPKLKQLGDRLHANLPHLVALSDPGGGIDAIDQANKAWVPAHATLGMAHMDRSDNTNEWKWRHVRKAWEAGNDPHCQSGHTEPGGPRSSVAEFPEPLHNAMLRAVAIIMGWEDYCFHNAAGVQGVVDPGHNRPANLWEVPGIDQAMEAARAVDRAIPSWASDGQATRGGDPPVGPHPLACDQFWPARNLDHGVTRDYARVNGLEFVQCLQGIKNYVNVKAYRRYHVKVYDPITKQTSTFDLDGGASHRIDAQSRDSRGYGGLIVSGTAF